MLTTSSVSLWRVLLHVGVKALPVTHLVPLHIFVVKLLDHKMKTTDLSQRPAVCSVFMSRVTIKRICSVLVRSVGSDLHRRFTQCALYTLRERHYSGEELIHHLLVDYSHVSYLRHVYNWFPYVEIYARLKDDVLRFLARSWIATAMMSAAVLGHRCMDITYCA